MEDPHVPVVPNINSSQKKQRKNIFENVKDPDVQQVLKKKIDILEVETPKTNEEIVKDKIKETCIERYGVENVFQDEKVKVKSKKSNLEKYGHVCILQSDSILKKIRLKYYFQSYFIFLQCG